MMACPLCGDEMRSGTVTYRSNFRDAVLGGSAYRQVLFLPDGAPPQEQAEVRIDGSGRGFQCRTCAAVLILGPEPDAGAAPDGGE